MGRGKIKKMKRVEGEKRKKTATEGTELQEREKWEEISQTEPVATATRKKKGDPGGGKRKSSQKVHDRNRGGVVQTAERVKTRKVTEAGEEGKQNLEKEERRKEGKKVPFRREKKDELKKKEATRRESTTSEGKDEEPRRKGL